MTKRNNNVIGSVSGVAKAGEKGETITSDPGKIDTPERDSGPADDPSVTGPVETDGNLDPVQLQTNKTIASDNPTNAEVAEANENGDTVSSDGEPDLDREPSLFDGTDASVDEEIEDIQLSDEDIAKAAAELEAEKQDEEVVTEAVVEFGELKPAINQENYRNTFVNAKGDKTVMDDETAAMFHNNPKFYEYTYDCVTGKNTHVDFLRWANADGVAVGGKVGDHYELDV